MLKKWLKTIGFGILTSFMFLKRHLQIYILIN
jgi:hypothetical protein